MLSVSVNLSRIFCAATRKEQFVPDSQKRPILCSYSNHCFKGEAVSKVAKTFFDRYQMKKSNKFSHSWFGKKQVRTLAQEWCNKMSYYAAFGLETCDRSQISTCKYQFVESDYDSYDYSDGFVALKSGATKDRAKKLEELKSAKLDS